MIRRTRFHPCSGRVPQTWEPPGVRVRRILADALYDSHQTTYLPHTGEKTRFSNCVQKVTGIQNEGEALLLMNQFSWVAEHLEHLGRLGANSLSYTWWNPLGHAMDAPPQSVAQSLESRGGECAVSTHRALHALVARVNLMERTAHHIFSQGAERSRECKLSPEEETRLVRVVRDLGCALRQLLGQHMKMAIFVEDNLLDGNMSGMRCFLPEGPGLGRLSDASLRKEGKVFGLWWGTWWEHLLPGDAQPFVCKEACPAVGANLEACYIWEMPPPGDQRSVFAHIVGKMVPSRNGVVEMAKKTRNLLTSEDGSVRPTAAAVASRKALIEWSNETRTRPSRGDGSFRSWFCPNGGGGGAPATPSSRACDERVEAARGLRKRSARSSSPRKARARGPGAATRRRGPKRQNRRVLGVMVNRCSYLGPLGEGGIHMTPLRGTCYTDSEWVLTFILTHVACVLLGETFEDHGTWGFRMRREAIDMSSWHAPLSLRMGVYRMLVCAPHAKHVVQALHTHKFLYFHALKRAVLLGAAEHPSLYESLHNTLKWSDHEKYSDAFLVCFRRFVETKLRNAGTHDVRRFREAISSFEHEVQHSSSIRPVSIRLPTPHTGRALFGIARQILTRKLTEPIPWSFSEELCSTLNRDLFWLLDPDIEVDGVWFRCTGMFQSLTILHLESICELCRTGGSMSRMINLVDRIPLPELASVFCVLREKLLHSEVYTFPLPERWADAQVRALRRRMGLSQRESLPESAGAVYFCQSCMRVRAYIVTADDERPLRVSGYDKDILSYGPGSVYVSHCRRCHTRRAYYRNKARRDTGCSACGGNGLYLLCEGPYVNRNGTNQGAFQVSGQMEHGGQSRNGDRSVSLKRPRKPWGARKGAFGPNAPPTPASGRTHRDSMSVGSGMFPPFADPYGKSAELSEYSSSLDAARNGMFQAKMERLIRNHVIDVRPGCLSRPLVRYDLLGRALVLAQGVVVLCCGENCASVCMLGACRITKEGPVCGVCDATGHDAGNALGEESGGESEEEEEDEESPEGEPRKEKKDESRRNITRLAKNSKRHHIDMENFLILGFREIQHSKSQSPVRQEREVVLGQDGNGGEVTGRGGDMQEPSQPGPGENVLGPKCFRCESEVNENTCEVFEVFDQKQDRAVVLCFCPGHIPRILKNPAISATLSEVATDVAREEMDKRTHEESSYSLPSRA